MHITILYTSKKRNSVQDPQCKRQQMKKKQKVRTAMLPNKALLVASERFWASNQPFNRQCETETHLKITWHDHNIHKINTL